MRIANCDDKSLVFWRDQLNHLAGEYALADRFPDLYAPQCVLPPDAMTPVLAKHPSYFQHIDGLLPYILKNRTCTELDPAKRPFRHPLLEPRATARATSDLAQESNAYAIDELFERSRPNPVHSLSALGVVRH